MIKLIGALTNKPYAFQHRPWELNIINTIDITDSLGCYIKVYTYGSEIKRVLPGRNSWISNKTRYFFEGLLKWRVNIPMLRKKKKLTYVSWTQAFFFLSLNLWFLSYFFKSKHLILLQSFLIDFESLVTSKLLTKKIGVYLYLKDLLKLNDFYMMYINPNFFNEVDHSKIFIFIGINFRLEAPVLGVKLRQKFLKESLLYGVLGSTYNDSLNSILLGLNINNLLKFLKGKLHFCRLMLKALIYKNAALVLNGFNPKIMFLLGTGLLHRADNAAIIQSIHYFFKNVYNKKALIKQGFFLFQTFNTLGVKKIQYSTNRINILYLYITSILYNELNTYQSTHAITSIKNNSIIYALGNVPAEVNLKKVPLYIYQGHHINKDYLKVDIILPSMTFFEKKSKFLNIEGTLLKTNIIMSSPKFSRNDWSIFNALYIFLYNFVKKIFKIKIVTKITYLNSKSFNVILNKKKKIYFYLKQISVNFYFKVLTVYTHYNYTTLFLLKAPQNNRTKIFNSILYFYNYNFYKMDIISQNAKTLNLCAQLVDKNMKNYTNI